MAVAIAETHKERFIKLLHELFQLDKPELDFGLYRIMHAKSDQLSRFIREDLAQAIENAFAEQGEQQLSAMRHDIDEKRKQAEELGAPDPDSAPAVKQARAAYHVAKQEQSASVDIYDHLYRFFSRYYDKGDFMSRRHHVAENDSRAAPYAVPYDGREVYLHWANKDQYYVKSSETLANFTFNLNEALKTLQGSAAQTGLAFDSTDAALKVHCRVVDATEGEHNDVKESTERFFIIHHDEPIRLDGADLVLQFEYRPDPEKFGQSGTWQKKRLVEAEELIMEALRATDGVVAYRENLATRAPTDKQKERTLLGKYLQQYTARNTMDYFIHKDLGGFLSRELDFYIKNEILRLDDIDDADVLIVEQQLKKIQVLRKLAKKIINFLAQLENFQKKLWLKKKFVTSVNYCFSVDLFASHEEVLKEVFKSKSLREQWQNIYSLDLKKLDAAISTQGIPDVANDSKYSKLMIDTGCINTSLKEKVISCIENISCLLNGVLINSENSQAIRLAEKLFEGEIKAIFTDPPYNTGSDGFVYKDGLQSSSWLSLIFNRMDEAKKLLSDNSLVFICIDDKEHSNLRGALNSVLGSDNFVANLVWQKNYSPRNTAKYFSEDHDHILVYAKEKSSVSINLLPRSDEAKSRYINPDNDPRGPWKSGDLSARNSYSQGVYQIECPSGRIIKGPPNGMYWRVSKPKLEEMNADGRIWWGEDGNNTPSIKRFISEVRDGVVPKTIWGYKEVGHTQEAKRELLSMTSEEGVRGIINTLKPTRLISKSLQISTSPNTSDWVFDMFGGSGSTGHAVIDLNRQDNGNRKYFMIEMGGYFDTVLMPRVKKIAFSKKWKDGVPIEIEGEGLSGVSHAFKYLRLESYDDTLNNLELDEDPKRDALMEQHPELRHDYTLKYLLDVETRGSASLLNTEWFRDPENYMLKVKQPGSDESRKTAVDLVETFNWLIGLHVSHLDKPRTYVARFERETDPELPEDQNTRLKAVSLRENEDGAYWIRQVEGHVRRIPGSDEDLAKVLVVWRKLTDDAEKDAAVLEALLEKYKIGTTDSEFDTIYINGPHGLNLSGRARDRVHSLEETFHARMWEGCDDDL